LSKSRYSGIYSTKGELMWKTEFSLDTELPVALIWKTLVDIETGIIPMANGDRRELHTIVGVGATMTSTAVGILPLQSKIIELVENSVLAIQTGFNGLELVLRHTLQPLADGGTHIVRELVITGGDVAIQGPIAGPRISEDYPEALRELVYQAHSRS
jgi:hypothetical protein